MIDGKLLIVTSSPGSRDTIYVGYAKRSGDLLSLTQASMILRYEDVGVAGISTQPEKATRLRPVTSPGGEVLLYMGSIAGMVVACPDAWEGHLGVSRDG